MSTRRRLPAGCTHAVPMLRVALPLLMLLVIPTIGFGQLEDLLPRKSKAGGPGKAKFTATVTPESAAPGDEVTLSISAQLPQGYYIYSTTGDFGGRTKIDLKAVGLDAVDEDLVPDRPAKTVFEPLFKAEVGKFFDEVTWTRKYRVQADAKEASLSGTLSGQYCSGADAEVGQCVPIVPPYEFHAEVQVTGESSATAQNVFAQHVQPTRRGKKGMPEPAAIAWDFSLSPTNAKPGDKVTFAVKATLNEGWHTFSLTQKDEGGTATVIDVSQLVGLTPQGDGFVADQPFEIEEDNGHKLEVHNHEVIWRRDFIVLPDVQPGAYGMSGEVSYQYCKNVCIQGKTAFTVGQSLFSQVPQTEPSASTTLSPSHPDVRETNATASIKPQDQSLPAFLLLCLGGGFLALLTPCSFPMVPITVSFFLKQSESQHQRPWLLALVYCGSIVAAFTILGVGIAFLFGAAQLNALANITWLNFIIGLVFVLFALNMLGMFEIRVPGWLLTMTASKESASSYLGAVFMALTFTLTSFTCTFAIAGSLLVIASKGEIYRPVIGMLAFGTAFAAPFFILAMVPGLLKKLPKSGGWMNSVKVVMGLLELGAAVKFFSIADPSQVVFDHVLVMLIWLVLALVMALYLFGWFRLPHDTPSPAISPIRMLLGTSFLILTGLLLAGVAMPERGGFVVQQILAFAPTRIEGSNGQLGPSLKHHGLEFALYVDKAIPVAQKEQKPLLLDFTGVNCTNCRNMELLMGQTAWKERIAKFVGVQLYVDVPQIPTISDIAEGKRLQQQNIALHEELLGDVTMPHYAVVTPDGKEVLATFLGKETIPGTFVHFLDEGWAKWEQLQKGGQAIGKVSDRQDFPVSR